MRDEQIKTLRPSLDIQIEHSDVIESFQNLTLRPILKLQYPLTAKLLSDSDHFTKLKERVDSSNAKMYEEIVTKYLSSNIFFKNKLIGCIIGMFTETEMDFYLEHSQELNKRIINMQIQRYVS